MVNRSDTRIALTVLFVLSFLWIANPWQYYFLNDDFFHIPLAASKNFVHGTLLRPVSDISLWIDHGIWGKRAFGYHITNTLIHLFNTWLVYLLARRLFNRFDGDEEKSRYDGDEERSRDGGGKDGSRGGGGKEKSPGNLKAWLAAMLFLLYAFHSEPVFWIIGRGGSLATLFFLAACLCYLERNRSAWNFFFSLLFFCIGLLVYESIWIFPAVALFISIAGLRNADQGRSEDPGGHVNRRRKEALYLLSIAGIFVLYLLFRYSQTGDLAGNYEARIQSSGNLFRLLYNYNTLFARCFLPPMASGKGFLFSYIVLVVVLLLAVLYILRKKNAGARLTVLLIVCFLVSLLPPVSLGIDTHDSESERFIYLPSVFAVLLLTELIFRSARRSSLAMKILLLLIVAHAVELGEVSLSYRYAGKVARRSLEIIDAGRPVRNLVLIRAPTQYRGALIFRSGLRQALGWLDPKLSYRYLMQVDSAEMLEKRDSFPAVAGSISSAAIPGMTISADPMAGGWKLSGSGTSYRFLPDSDRIVYWTDSSLGIIGR